MRHTNDNRRKYKVSFFFGKIHRKMSLPFFVELRFNFICPLYIRAIFSIHKLNCSLRNEIDRICCFLKTTQKLIIIHLTNRCISWYDMNGKEAWNYVLFKTNFTAQFKCRTRQSNFCHICAVVSRDIVQTSFISPNKMTFGNFVFNGSLNVFVTLPIMTSESHHFWQFQGPR